MSFVLPKGRGRAALYSQKPLSGVSTLAIGAAAALVTLVYYLFALAALLVLTALIIVIGAFGICSIRFPTLAMAVFPVVGAQARLAFLLLGSLCLGRDRTARLTLEPGDAPRLYSVLERLAGQVGVSPPREILMESGAGAAVRLRGHLQGRGRTTLFLGFDLIAGLDEPELEAVLAHELAHARLVQRGYQGWLSNGLGRIAQLAGRLEGVLAEAPREGKDFYSARLIRWCANGLGSLLARLVAALSREDEFAADRLAADVCGASVFASALLRTTLVQARAVELPWRERVLQTQRDGSFTEWLRDRLDFAGDDERRTRLEKELAEEKSSDLDTHPATMDRVAVLGCPSLELLARSEGAAALLAEPDALAARLIHLREDEAEKAQRQESARRLKAVRRRLHGSNRIRLRPLLLGLSVLTGLMALFFLGAGIVGSGDERSVSLILGGIVSVICLGSSAGLLALPARPRRLLPVPAITDWQEAMDRRNDARAALPPTQQIAAETEAALPSGVRGRRERLSLLCERAYEALGRCDYRAALGAALLIRAMATSAPEAIFADAVASGYFGLDRRVGKGLDWAIGRFGLEASVSWAAAWSLLAEGRWSDAEPFLMAAVEARPDEPTLWSLLGETQWRRDKNQEAIRTLERAVGMEPGEPSHRFPLVLALLELGRATEAEKHLQALDRSDPEDRRVVMGWLRTDLLLGRAEDAGVRTALISEKWPEAGTWGELGHAHYEAGDKEAAERFFQSACAAGYWPDALFRLGQIYAERGFPEAARSYFTAALDLTRPASDGAAHPLQMLPAVVDALHALSEPQPGCSAWTTTLTLFPPVGQCGGLGLAVQAPSLKEAEYHTHRLYEAIYPGRSFPAALVRWVPVPASQVPEGPLRPGIAGCWPVDSVF